MASQSKGAGPNGRGGGGATHAAPPLPPGLPPQVGETRRAAYADDHLSARDLLLAGDEHDAAPIASGDEVEPGEEEVIAPRADATFPCEKCGADLRFIQQLLGHEKLETTQIYTEVSIKQLQEVHERTHPARLRD